MLAQHEAVGELPNPLGVAGIEFVEYATARPQALGQVLETMGFRPVARHRSREVMLYRQGTMNIVVNAHGSAPSDRPRIAAFALRVRDASQAYRRALELGAWAVPVQVEPMELHIPAIHGVGDTRLYLVDRWRDGREDGGFSIFDVDFLPIPGADPYPPATAGLRWFGIVHYVGNDRTYDWTDFYGGLFGFSLLPADERFGILPRGAVLASPCGSFYLQLVEPEPSIVDVEGQEALMRVAFGTPDVLDTVGQLRARGMPFFEAQRVHTDVRGALTDPTGTGVTFELVHVTR